MYQLAAIVASLAIAYIATSIHLSVLTAASRMSNVKLVTLVVLLAHIVEIQVYALCFVVFSNIPGFGCIRDLSGSCVYDWLEMSYYSAAVYTTLGFGDLTPSGPMRILTGIEAVVGLALIAWSATFTFRDYIQRQPLPDTAET